jgi:arylsulfatase A-like enzyme
MDPHAPYCPAAETFRELTGRDISATRARYLNEFWNRSDLPAARLEPQKKSVVELYDASIRSMDTQVARLVTHLKQSALWDNCMFVLTADHGEEFLDHGRRYHAPVSLYDEVVRVPLLIRVPQSETKLEKSSTNKNMSANPFSHLHLAPTLLNILGVPAPQSFRGTSLWRNLQQGTSRDTPSVTECVYGCTNPFRTQSRIAPRLLSVRNLSHKLVIKVSSGATEEFYDLQADPRETKPLPAVTEKDARKQLLQAAWAHMQQTISNKDATKRLRLRLRDIQVQLQSNFR